MHGQGAVACFPWDIGSHYEQQCHQGHASLVMGTIDSLLGLDRRLHVAASPSVEVTHRIGTDGKFEWVALFNHSGQQGKALHGPIPIRDIRINLRPQKAVKTVRLLQAGSTLSVSAGQQGALGGRAEAGSLRGRTVRVRGMKQTKHRSCSMPSVISRRDLLRRSAAGTGLLSLLSCFSLSGAGQAAQASQHRPVHLRRSRHRLRGMLWEQGRQDAEH